MSVRVVLIEVALGMVVSVRVVLMLVAFGMVVFVRVFFSSVASSICKVRSGKTPAI